MKLQKFRHYIDEANAQELVPVKDDDKEATKNLWKNFSVKVMPGSFMAKEVNGFNPGKGFLRISLVDKEEVIEETMRRICLFLELSSFQK